MKIIYYLKNLKVSKAISEFIQKRLSKLDKVVPEKEEGLVEVELIKDKEVKNKEGLFKAKFIVEIPKKSLIIVQGVGKTLFQAIQDGFKKLKRQFTKKS